MWFLTQEQQALQSLARDFAKRELAPQIQRFDQTGGFHREAFSQLGRLGLLGITVPEAEGGGGLDAVSATLVIEELGAVDASTALSYLAHMILCVHSLSRHGSPEQKSRYLPGLLRGDQIGGLALSEPQSGSDALGMQLQARLVGDGDYCLNGTKTWITNAPVGDVFYCYARTGSGKKEISTFIVERGTPGFFQGKPISKLGMRASPTGELHFENCLLPKSQRVGAEGASVPQLLTNLNLERITISAISLGIARSCIEVASRYAVERYAFGKPIGSYQQIQGQLAEASAEYASSRSLTYEAAKRWDLGEQQSVGAFSLAAKAKLKAAQMATQVALQAIQILGAAGYSCEFPVERYLRDAKLIEIGAGTNEILRILIARELLGKELTRF